MADLPACNGLNSKINIFDPIKLFNPLCVKNTWSKVSLDLRFGSKPMTKNGQGNCATDPAGVAFMQVQPSNSLGHIRVSEIKFN